MKNMVLTKINAYRYIDSVRDGNKIHQSDVDARGYGLPEAIVPGMWLASHIQGRASISSISQIKFSGKVFYNEDVTINELPNVIGRGRDYIFKKGDDIVCKANGVKIGEYRDSCRQLNETLHMRLIFVPKELVYF